MVSFTDDQIEQVKEIMDGRVGREHAITSSELRDRLHIDENETTPQTRALITYLIKEEGWPIVAKTGQPAGYYIAEDEEDIYEYITTLTGRINNIDERRVGVLTAAQESEHLSLVPDEFDEDIL